ncbi:hypothetical protein NKF26_14490 [Haladaptatus sp. AB618]|uniref:hypothetical protein n=1 Tax=Haladaptatus sp. AB618 TaxID=2934173 RepID=UPI00209BFA89|nr:hypothetical protein [Haladaptatus sp. AB618]MCO8255009.1 hypothetical protein [Haladaptatus sp. AB618]
MVYDTHRNRVNFIGLSKEAVAAAYRSLPVIVAVSVCWCLLAPTIVLLGPVTATAVAAAGAVLRGDRFRLGAATTTFRRYFWRSQFPLVPTFVLIDVVVFSWLQFRRTGEFAYGVLAFFAVDTLVVLLVLLLYYYPLLVDADRSARETARRSAELAFERFVPTVGLVAFCLSIGLLFGFTVAGFVLLAPGVVATVLTLATRYLSTGAS